MNRFSRQTPGTGTLPRALLAAVGLALIGWVLSGDVRIAGGPGIGVTEMAVLGLGGFNLLVALLRARWVAGLLLLQVSLGLTFIVAEFALRMTLSYRYYTPYKLEPRYLYDLTPGAVREHRILPENGGANIYRVNSLGFRGEEFAPAPGAAPRVVIYGDSFIHAEYTALENTLAVQLRQQLEQALSQPVEVINAGVAGYGPDQALRRIEDEIGWLQPDVVVMAVFTGNDYGDLVRNKIYRLGADGTLRDNDYSYSDEILFHAQLEEKEFITKRIVREAVFALLPSLSPVQMAPFDAQRNIEAALQQHLDEYEDFVVNGDNVIRELRSDPYSADISLLPDSPSARYKLGLMSGVIQRAAEVTAAVEVPLLVVGIPHPMDVLNGAHSSGRVDRAQYPDYQPERLTGSLQDIAAERGVAQLNLLPHFRAVDDPAALFLQRGDDHWNDAGQRYAAELIAAQLLSSGWLPQPD